MGNRRVGRRFAFEWLLDRRDDDHRQYHGVVLESPVGVVGHELEYVLHRSDVPIDDLRSIGQFVRLLADDRFFRIEPDVHLVVVPIVLESDWLVVGLESVVVPIVGIVLESVLAVRDHEQFESNVRFLGFVLA